MPSSLPGCVRYLRTNCTTSAAWRSSRGSFSEAAKVWVSGRTQCDLWRHPDWGDRWSYSELPQTVGGCIGLAWGMLPCRARHSFRALLKCKRPKGDDVRKKEEVVWRWEGVQVGGMSEVPKRWSPGCRRSAPWPPGPRSVDTPRREWRGSEHCPGRSGTEAREAGRCFRPDNPPAENERVKSYQRSSVNWHIGQISDGFLQIYEEFEK